MPQLDKYSFIPQLLWFFVIFFLLFLFFAQSVLPTIARSLKIRDRVIDGFSLEKNASASDLGLLNAEIAEGLERVQVVQSKTLKTLHTEAFLSSRAADLVLRKSVLAEGIRNQFQEEIAVLRIKAIAANELFKG